MKILPIIAVGLFASATVANAQTPQKKTNQPGSSVNNDASTKGGGSPGTGSGGAASSAGAGTSSTGQVQAVPVMARAQEEIQEAALATGRRPVVVIAQAAVRAELPVVVPEQEEAARAVAVAVGDPATVATKKVATLKPLGKIAGGFLTWNGAVARAR